MQKLSVVIISKNEERLIESVVQAARKVTDDIILIDSGSSDRTVALATSAGARCIDQVWLGYSATKNFGTAQAKHDWILSLDADEVMDDALIDQLNTLSLSRDCIYELSRITNYCGQWIKHSGWYPDYITRLYHKEDHHWNEKLVHESLTDIASKKVTLLSGLLLHYSYASLEQHQAKCDKYAKYRAQEWIASHKKPAILKQWFGPTVRFIRNYVWQRGFLDGKAGYNIAINEAKMVKMQFIYYNELSSKPRF